MRYLILFLYLIANVFLYILNFELFNSQANVDFGFGVFHSFPFIVLQFLGLFFIGLFVILDQKKEAKKEAQFERLEDKNQLLQKDLEIVNLKLQNQPEVTIITPEENTEL